MVQPRSRGVNLPALAIAGVVALTLLGLCCAGGFYYLHSRPDAVVARPTPSDAAPTGSPTPTPTPTGPVTGAACIIGRWRDVSGQTDAKINGETVRLTWSGALQTFTADGVALLDLGTGVAKTGTLHGDTYVIASSGTITFHYQVSGNQILYSDAHADGSTTWYINGTAIDEKELVGALSTETFTCTGNSFTQIGDGYTIDLARL